MAGKVATIGDLFAPMQSIQTCMESQGMAINDNLVSINNSIIGCASVLSESANLISDAAESMKSDISKSINDLNKAIDKQLSSIIPSRTKIGSSLNTSLNELNRGVAELVNSSVFTNEYLKSTQDELNAISGKVLTSKDGGVILDELRTIRDKKHTGTDVSGIVDELKSISKRLVSLNGNDAILEEVKNVSKKTYPVADVNPVVQKLNEMSGIMVTGGHATAILDEIRNIEGREYTGVDVSPVVSELNAISDKIITNKDTNAILDELKNISDKQYPFIDITPLVQRLNEISGKVLTSKDTNAILSELKNIGGKEYTSTDVTPVVQRLNEISGKVLTNKDTDAILDELKNIGGKEYTSTTDVTPVVQRLNEISSKVLTSKDTNAILAELKNIGGKEYTSTDVTPVVQRLNEISGKVLTSADIDRVLSELKGISGKQYPSVDLGSVVSELKNISAKTYPSVSVGGVVDELKVISDKVLTKNDIEVIVDEVNAIAKREFPVADNTAILKRLNDLYEKVLSNKDTDAILNEVRNIYKKEYPKFDTTPVVKSVNEVSGKVVTGNDIKTLADKLNAAIHEQSAAVAAASVSTGGSVGAAMSGVSNGINTIVSEIAYISKQLTTSTRHLTHIYLSLRKMSKKKGVKDVMSVKDTGKAGIMSKMFASKTERKASRVNIPDVKGGKNVGEVVNAMADAAVKMDKISLAKSITLKKKIKGIFDAFFNTMKKHEKNMNPAKMKNYEVAVISMRRISDKIHDMARELAAIVPIGVFAKIGVKMAGSIIRNMMLALLPLERSKNIAKTEVAAMTLKRISKSILMFTVTMSLTAVVAPIAVIGTKLTSIVIRSALTAIRPLGRAKKLVETRIAADNLKLIAASLLVFEASMALTTVLAPVAMVGALLTGLLLKQTKFMMRSLSTVKTTKNVVQTAINLAIIGKSILVFEASMALTTILAPVALIGFGLTALLLKGTHILFANLGSKIGTHNVRSGTYNMMLMTSSMILFTLGILATTMITKYIITGGNGKVNWTNVASLAGAVGIFGLMVGSYYLFRKLGSGRGIKNVNKASIAILLMSASFIAFSVSLLVADMITKVIVGNSLKSGKADMTDVAGFAGTVAIYGLMIGSYYLFKKIGSAKNVKNAFAGFGAIAAMSLGIVMFATSLYITHQITKQFIKEWKGGVDIFAVVMDLAVFGLMLGSMFVYNRLGSAKNTKNAFAGFGAIAAMSLGLVLFSAALYITDNIVGHMWKTNDGKMDWMSIIKTVAVFGLMFGSMYIFKQAGKGNNMKTIMKGAAAIGVMSVAIAVFGFSIVPAVTAIERVSMTTIIAMPVLIFSFVKLFQYAGKGNNMKDIMKGAGAVAVMGIALGVFGFALGYFVKSINDANMQTLIMMPVLVGLFVAEFTVAGKFFKDILIGSGVVIAMSVALGVFGYGVKFYVDAIKDIGWKQVGMMAALIGIFGAEFAVLGIPAVAALVALGSAATAAMGLGLLSFGTGVTEYANSIKDVGTEDTKKMAMLIGIFGGEFALLGPLSPAIMLSNVAFSVMSPALILFGKGVEAYSKSVENTDFETMKKMATLIGVFGGEFALIGPLAPMILLSDAAFAVMGAAFIPFSYGVEQYASVMDNRTFDDIKKMATLIGVFGGEFALIGPLTPLVMLGAGAISIMSGSLSLLGKALQEWSKANLDEKQLNLICVSIDRLKLAYMGDPKGEQSGKSGGGIGAFFKKIGNAVSGAITGAFDIGQVTTTATAITIISGSLSALGKSLQSWNDVNINEHKLDMLCLSIDRIKLAFQGNPNGEKGSVKGLLGRIHGGITEALTAPFDIMKVRATSAALLTAGSTIRSLAKGMNEWSNSNIDMSSITSISTVLVAVRDIFSVLGDEKQRDTKSVEGWLGKHIAKFAPSDATKGAAVAKKMGGSLKEIANGLLDFYNVYGSKFNSKEFMDKFTQSVATTVSSLTEAFRTVGEAYMAQPIKPAAKWNLFGRMWQDMTVNTFGPSTKNAVKEGIKNVKGIGDALKDIANGVKEFKDIIPSGNDSFMVRVAAGISALLKGIQEPLIAFGTTDESFSIAAKKSAGISQKYGSALSSIDEISAQTINYEKHKVDVTAALQHVGEIGRMVEGLANGAKTLASGKLTGNLGTYGKVNEDFVVEGGDGLVGNMQKLLCANLGVFVQLGKKVKEYGMHEVFEDQVVQDVQKGLFGTSNTTNKAVRVKKGEESYIGIAVQAAAGIGGVIVGLAEGYERMNKSFPSDEKMTEGVARVSKSIISILDVFSSLGGVLVKGRAGTMYVSSSNPEMYKKVGDIPGIIHNLYEINIDTFESVRSKIEAITTGISESVSKLADRSSNFIAFSKNASLMMDSIANITAMSYLLCEHGKDDVVPYYKNGVKIGEYKTIALYSNMLDVAKSNASVMREVTTTMSNASSDLSKLNVSASNSFVTFANNLTKGINTLAGSSTNIQHSTTFVNSLRSAVKEKVFDNISSNTERIANAINGLNNDVMKPYAEMIAGMGKLVEAEKTKTTQVLNEIKKTVEDIVEIVNRGGSGGGSGSGSGNGNGSGGGGDKPAPKPTPQKPQEQRPQKVSVTTTLDATQFNNAVAAFADAVKKIPQ